jgi:hypothetical protein
MPELGWKLLQRWQDRQSLYRPPLDCEREQYIPLIPSGDANDDLSPSSPYEPSGLPLSTDMVNFSSQPDEIIVSEKQRAPHPSSLDPIEIESEKPYHNHLESSKSIEGHSLGAQSTRDTEKGTASEYATSVDGSDHVTVARAEKRLLRKLGTCSSFLLHCVPQNSVLTTPRYRRNHLAIRGLALLVSLSGSRKFGKCATSGFAKDCARQQR